MITTFEGRKILPFGLRRNLEGEYCTLLLALLTILLFGPIGIRSLLAEAAATHAELAYGAAYDEKLAAKIAALEEAKEELSKITPTQQKAINTAVPDAPTQAELVEELSIDSGRAEFLLRTISFLGKEEVGDGIATENFECALKGSPSKLIGLLDEIAKGRLISIEKLRFSWSDTASTDIEISLTAKSFYYERSQE